MFKVVATRTRAHTNAHTRARTHAHYIVVEWRCSPPQLACHTTHCQDAHKSLLYVSHSRSQCTNLVDVSRGRRRAAVTKCTAQRGRPLQATTSAGGVPELGRRGMVRGKMAELPWPDPQEQATSLKRSFSLEDNLTRQAAEIEVLNSILEGDVVIEREKEEFRVSLLPPFQRMEGLH